MAAQAGRCRGGGARSRILPKGLGIGANTTIFTFSNSVFLNPLPVAKPFELVAVFTVDEANPGQFSNLLPVSRLNYEDYRDTNDVLSGISPTDPLTYSGVAGLLVSVALVASGLPAYRAGRVDPLTALRSS